MVEETEVQSGDKMPSKFIYISDKTRQDCVCSPHQHHKGIHEEVLVQHSEQFFPPLFTYFKLEM